MYLWRRKLGTSEYASGFLVRWVDEWIARLVNYREARANYAMLNEIPARLRAHVEGLGESVVDRDAIDGQRAHATASKGCERAMALSGARMKSEGRP